MYVIFMIALQNYEKNVHVHNYRFFERDCVLIILFYGSKAPFLEVIYSGWVSMTTNLKIGRKTNPILIIQLIQLNTILKQPI